MRDLISTSPLQGIKVLDLTRMVSGPVATQTLADLGATVYKVERREGDDSRRFGPFLKDRAGGETDDSAYFLAYNRGKRSITIDLATREGQSLVRRLAGRCDVMIENFKVGALARYGLGYEEIAAVRPDIVYCSISGFGQDGPYASRPAYDTIMQSMAGLMSSNGTPPDVPGSEPLRTAIPITDIVAGLHAASAILAALHARHVTGRGQYVDVSLFDAAVGLNGHLAIEYLMTGSVPPRAGNRNPVTAPSEPFECRDGKVMIGIGNDAQFERLCAVLGVPQLGSHERFATNTARVRHRAELHALLESRTRERTIRGLSESLARANVPAGEIFALEQVFGDPQVAHRQMATQEMHHRGVPVPLLHSPIRLSNEVPRHSAPPALGQHTDEILASELGLSHERIATLRASGVV